MGFKAQLSFRNEKQVQFLSKNIAQHFGNRGVSWADKVATVLRDLKETTDINTLKKLDEGKIQEYVSELRESVENGDIKAETAQTYISALNTVLDYTNNVNNTNFSSISAAANGISASVDYSDKSVSGEIHQSFQNFLQEKFEQTGDSKFEHLQTAIELQREFGLRFRESVGLNIKTIEKSLESGKLELSRTDWTKNARPRIVEIRTTEQKELLQKVQNTLQQTGKVNLAGAEKASHYKEIASFRNFADRARQEFTKTGENYNFHGERHTWAQSQYSAKWEQKTGIAIQSPIKYYSSELEAKNWDGSGKFYDAVKEYDITPFREYVQEQVPEIDFKEIDNEIRQEISEELGHNRLDITNTYLGHP